MGKARQHRRERVSLWRRYRALPKLLRSRRAADRREGWRLLAILFCLLALLLSLFYMLHWEFSRRTIERDNAAFSALYHPATPAPDAESPTPEPAETSAPSTVAAMTASAGEPVQAAPSAVAAMTASAGEPVQAAPSAVAAMTASAGEAVQAAPSTVAAMTASAGEAVQAAPSASPAASVPASAGSKAPEPIVASTAEASPSATPGPTPVPFEIARDATRAPLATPDANTRIFALQTPPPAQSSFADLLATNPDTVGFLRIGDVLSLPVVQRKNDNETYLNHSFNLEESIAGTLFLDGSNLLVPEDNCLIVYGHNMRNGTMFHQLLNYAELSFLKANALVSFDTIYENRSYVPFAVLTVTAEPDSARYVNLRQFSLEDDAFDDFTAQLKSLSQWNIPVEVAPGDRLLLLVTCEYTHNNGRFVIALRQLRPGEDENAVRAQIGNTRAR